MTAEELKQLFAMYLPAILAVLAALGVWKALAGVGHLIVAQIRKAVKASKSKADDAVVLPIADALDKLLDDVAAGRVPVGAAQAAARDLVLPKR